MLHERIAQSLAVVKDACPLTLNAAEFSHDAAVCAAYWDARRALIPMVAAVRESGTSVHTHTQTQWHARTHTHTHKDTHTIMHAHIHARARTHTYARTHDRKVYQMVAAVLESGTLVYMKNNIYIYVYIYIYI